MHGTNIKWKIILSKCDKESMKKNDNNMLCEPTLKRFFENDNFFVIIKVIY